MASAAEFCTRCGTARPTSAAFCPTCGQAFASVAEPPLQTASPPPSEATARNSPSRLGRTEVILIAATALVAVIGVLFALPRFASQSQPTPSPYSATATPAAPAPSQAEPGAGTSFDDFRKHMSLGATEIGLDVGMVSRAGSLDLALEGQRAIKDWATRELIWLDAHPPLDCYSEAHDAWRLHATLMSQVGDGVGAPEVPDLLRRAQIAASEASYDILNTACY